jgi:integrase
MRSGDDDTPTPTLPAHHECRRRDQNEWRLPPAPVGLADDEVRRLFTAIHFQPMSSFSNKTMVDPVLFRVPLRRHAESSEVLSLTLAGADTPNGTLRIRGPKNGKSRIAPVTARLAAPWRATSRPRTVSSETSDYVFYSIAARPPDQTGRLSTCGFATTWGRRGIPTARATRTHTCYARGSAAPTCVRWAEQGMDLAVILPI